MGIIEKNRSIADFIKGIVCGSEMKELQKCRESLLKLSDNMGGQILELKKELYDQNINNDILIESNNILRETNTELNTQVDGLITQVKQAKLSPVDLYCIDKYPVDLKVYKDKIKIGNVLMPCDLREIFTPNSYLVGKMKDSIAKSDDKLEWYRNIMHKVNLHLTWKAEAFDNYFYPPYTITIKECDCDDGAFLQMSIEPEFAVAFGFFIKDGKKIGHAFAVGIINNSLHVFDWVNNQSQPYPSDEYSINYIITPNQVYEVDGSTEFGDVLW